jgi:hypothetical protein
LREQAGGAKSGQRAGRERRAALRTFVGFGHWRIYFYRVHASFRSKTRWTLPEIFGKHPTTNIERPTSIGTDADFIGCSMLGVGCWMFSLHFTAA